MNYQNNKIGYIGFIDLMSRLKRKKGPERFNRVLFAGGMPAGQDQGAYLLHSTDSLFLAPI